MLHDYKKKISTFAEKYETHLEVFFFVGGFIFDMIFLSEVDDLFSIGQQVFYLWVVAAFIHYELLFRLHKWRPKGRFILKIWDYRNFILHFFLGNLLNIYSLFYIKSASLVHSLIFIAIMAVLVLANELPLVKSAKVSFKFGLYVICLYSFVAIAWPLILGFVGWTPFILSILTTVAILYGHIKLLQKKILDPGHLFRAILVPGYSVLSIFILFYFMGWIPPVPISVKVQGVYHKIEKQSGEYLLSMEKAWWQFWKNDDSDFQAEPGDKIYFYAQIYSPARFSDQVYVQWMWKNSLGEWQRLDRIPLSIAGGRQEGYRGYTNKANYQAGEWQVRVETANGQEISRLSFDVENSSVNPNRQFTIIKR